MRLFVAVDPSPEAAEHLGSVVSGLALGRPVEDGRSTGLIPPARWHLTLAFLGEVSDDRVDRAASAVERAASRVAAPLRVRLAGGGRFGRGRFTVMWTSLGGDVDGLRGLARDLRRELKRARLTTDPRPWKPHLTLARPGDRLTPGQVAADLAALSGYDGPEWTVDAMYLYRSHMGPKPRYERIAAAPLPTSPAPDR